MKQFYLQSQNNPRNEVDYDEFIQLIEDYHDRKLHNERLGQAFYNRFDTTGLPFPELFYTVDFRKTEELIYTNYKLIHEFTEPKRMDN